MKLKFQTELLTCTLHSIVFHDLNGLVKLAHFDLDWVGPHLGLLGRGQRSDCVLHSPHQLLLCVYF